MELLQILEGFQSGTIAALDAFVEQGILDKAGPMVIFTHDLIQQEIYEGMSADERLNLHMEIGQYLGKQLEVTIGMGQLSFKDHAFYVGRWSMTSSLVSLACDQINDAGPEQVGDAEQRRNFAEMNLTAGQKCARESNFCAALHYFLKGIAFLGDRCWSICGRLSRQLRQGVVSASFALSEFDSVIHYAEEVISNSPFQDTLEVQQLVLRTFSQLGRHKDCISKGMQILKKLDFDVKESPSQDSILRAVKSTENIIARCSLDHIMSLCERRIDDSSQNTVKILDASFVSCFSSGNLGWPLITCEIVKFSLSRGICSEAATAFASFGTFKIFLEGDFTMGQRMAALARAITAKHQTMNKSKIPRVENRAEIFLLNTSDIWWTSPREISNQLLEYYQVAMKCGQIDVATFSLRQSWRFKLLGGESLKLILQSAEDRLKLIAKHSLHSAKHGLLDSILLMELTGQSCVSFSLFDSIHSIDDVEREALSSKDNLLLFTVHLYKLMIAFWKGDHEAAEEASHAAWKVQPTAKMPTLYLICHTFFRGLVAFQLYRELGGIGGEHMLKEGTDMMKAMEKWTLNCAALFENKYLLLKAEYFASINENETAERWYILSVEASREHGNLHDLGLGYEFLGKYYSSRGPAVYSNHCFTNAHKYYSQWGAFAVAERILRENPDLDISSPVDTEFQSGSSSKRQRD